MLCECDLRKGVVYVPTFGRVEGGGGYRAVEPVAVVAVSNTQALRQALGATIARGNPAVANVLRANYPEPVVLKYTGVSSWSAYACGTLNWHIYEKDGNYQIVRSRTGRYGGWVRDPDQVVDFPPGTSVDAVIERMIEILQNAAQKGKIAEP